MDTSVRHRGARRVRRLTGVDWLIGTLLPICVYALVMTLVHGIRYGFLDVPFRVSSSLDAQSYPVVSLFFSEDSGVAVGDRVLSLEGVDLRGASAARTNRRTGSSGR